MAKIGELHDMGKDYGYGLAWELVGEIVKELHGAGEGESARLIHDKVWRRLRDERAKRVAES